MQLEYSLILQQVLPLICFNDDEERVKIELEKGYEYKVGGKSREIDLVLETSANYKIAVEMKCYREKAASGKKRGATDIFMKDVYEDLYLLESYCNEKGGFDKGVALVMNDLRRLVSPKNKDAKCWDYDISDGYEFSNPQPLTTPIGGKEVDIKLKKSYKFNWVEKGNKNNKFWFLENEGDELLII